MATTPTLHWHARLRRGFSDLLFILFTASAVLLFLVLIGYHNSDPGWSTSGTGGGTQHFLGTAGAYAADTLISLFGWSSYLLPIGLIIIAWLSVRYEQRENELIVFKFIALFASMLSFSCILALHVGTPINSLSVTGGGVIGQKMAQLMADIMPVRGIMYIATFFLLVGVLYITELNPIAIPDRLGYWTLKLFGKAQSRGLEKDLAAPVPEAYRSADSEGSAKRNILMKRLMNYGAKPQLEEPSDASPAALRQEPQLSAAPRTGRQEPNIALNWADYKDGAAEPVPANSAAPASASEAADFSLTEEEDFFAETDAPAEPKAADAFVFSSRPAASADNALAAIQGDDDDDDDSYDEDYPELSMPSTFDNTAQTGAAAESGAFKVRLGGAAPAPQPASAAVQPYSPVTPKPAAASSFYQHHADELPYRLPPLSLLKTAPPRQTPNSASQFETLAPKVETALKNYRLDVKVVGIDVGPVVTRLELDLAPGIKVSQIMNLDRDIARSLAVQSVRVVEVIPGKPYIGLEIPNKIREVVTLRTVMESVEYQNQKSPLTLVLGADIAGKPMVANLAKMPHLLVAGTTGSGKSVAINVMLTSMLYKAKPEELKLILIDPKMLEMSMYEDIPHLLTPVVTDMNDAENALRWAVAEMERRYQLMAAFKVRNIAGFNQHIRELQAQGARIDDPLWNPEDFIGLANQPPQITTLPYIVIVIDELADMMMAVGKSVEQLIARIAQKARAAGIHLILATQRPSVDVITGLIKANVPTRLAFQVSSKIDSRTIIDGQGAESLLGYGDGLFVPPGRAAAPQRVHGAFIEDSEVDALTTYLKTQGQPQYEESITNPVPAAAMGAYGAQEKSDDPEQDPLYDEACQVVIESGKASISYLQRRLQVGYNRAARMIEQMEYAGLVGPADRGQRKVLVGGGE